MATKKTKNNPKKRQYKQAQPIPYWIALLGVVIATLGAFWPALYNDFTNWDDLSYVIDNDYIKQLSWANLQYIFTQPIASNYHPLTILSLAFNYQLSQLEPWSYHLGNLLLHLGNTALVFLFIYQVTHKKLGIAFIVALFFGIHPMHVESVAWVAERKDVLYTFFFLLGLLVYHKYIENQQYKYLIYVFLFFFLSVLSKPSAVVFPLILWVLDYWKDRQDYKKVILEKIPFCLVALIFGLITVSIQRDSAIGSWEAYSVLERILFASYGFVMYIFKAFVPTPVVAFYPYPKTTFGLSWFYYVAPAIAIGIWLLVFYGKKYSRIPLVGLLFFTLNIFLVLQFVTVGEAIMANRYTYLSYVGLFLILAYGVDYLWRAYPKMNYPIVAGILALSVAYTIATQKHIKVWKNSLNLWTNVLEHFPNEAAIAYANRGNIYREKQQFEQALSDYNKALTIDEQYYLAYNNRAITYLNLQKFEEALKDFTKSIALKADYKILANRGTLYKKLGKRRLALQDFEQSLALQKNYEAFYARGILYSEQKNTFQQGIQDLESAAKIRPNFYFTYLIKGHLQRDNQLFEEALESYKQAWKVASEDENKANILAAEAKVHIQQQQYEIALKKVKKAISLNKNDKNLSLLRQQIINLQQQNL